MATVAQFFQFWALAFATLSLGLVLLNFFCRLINSDLDLHSFRKETVIAGVASAVQGAGFWFSASLFHGDPFRRLLIPSAIVGFIYWLTHLENWSGYEVGGIAFFQVALLSTGLCLIGGQFKLAVIILSAFVVGLVIVAGVARSL